MGFFKRFFGTKAGVRDSRLQAEAVDAAQGLDIDAAVAAHLQWKRQLQARLNEGGDPLLDGGPDCRDDRCDLGRWIHGRGRARLGTFPGFTELMAHHRLFHHVACNVVALKRAGKHADARRMMADQFESYSDRVTQDLRLLQQVVMQSRDTPPPQP